VRAIVTTPSRLPVPAPETPDDLARDWSELTDAEVADWEPTDPDLDPDAAQEPPEAEGREVLKSGRWDRARGDGGGFAAGGVADHLPPGPVLAGFAADAWAAGLGGLSDDELIGVMRAARRLASWAAAMELAAIGDLWRRRMAEDQAGDAGAACHAGDEIAAALTLTGRAADRVLDLAIALRRLPLTSESLAAGDIDLPRAIVIADEVTGLDDEHVAAVEHAITGSAPGQTSGQLRAATRRAVMAADPSAARRRKERAQQDARVERWDEHAGTAALARRDLPPASVLAADQNLTALARQLKAAGVPGTMDTLRAQVFLALLTETPVASLLPGDLPATREPAGTSGSAGLRETSNQLSGLRGTESLPTGLAGTVSPGLPTGLRGTVNLTMPVATWLGQSDAPGHVGGYGPLDAGDSRDLARALAARAGNPWCLTFTDARGRPVAHGCARAGPARAAGKVSGQPRAAGPGPRIDGPDPQVSGPNPHMNGPEPQKNPRRMHRLDPGVNHAPVIRQPSERSALVTVGPSPSHCFPALPATTPGKRRRTSLPPVSGICLRSGTAPAPSPGAGARPPSATRTTPCPTTRAGRPACAISLPFAGGITGPSKPTAGSCNSHAPGS
jgi:hypothetical protein